MTTTYTLKGRITEDHRLEVDLPDDLPAGDASVTVVVESEQLGAPRGSAAALLELFAQWDAEGYAGSGRTKEQVDAELNAMRDEWDRD